MKLFKLSLLVSSLVALSMGLTGCSTTYLAGVKYTHDSSIPDKYDWNESNMAGPFVRAYVCPEGRDSYYCPEVEVSALYEFHVLGPHHTYGRNPVGNVEVRFPVWTNQK